MPPADSQRGPELITLPATATDNGAMVKFWNPARVTEDRYQGVLHQKAKCQRLLRKMMPESLQASHSVQEVSKGPGALGPELRHQGKPRARKSLQVSGFLLR